MNDPFGLAGRPGGVQEEQRVLRVHPLALGGVWLGGDRVLPPHVAPRHHGAAGCGHRVVVGVDEAVLHRVAEGGGGGAGSVGDLLQVDDLGAAAHACRVSRRERGGGGGAGAGGRDEEEGWPAEGEARGKAGSAAGNRQGGREGRWPARQSGRQPRRQRQQQQHPTPTPLPCPAYTRTCAGDDHPRFGVLDAAGQRISGEAAKHDRVDGADAGAGQHSDGELRVGGQQPDSRRQLRAGERGSASQIGAMAPPPTPHPHTHTLHKQCHHHHRYTPRRPLAYKLPQNRPSSRPLSAASWPRGTPPAHRQPGRQPCNQQRISNRYEGAVASSRPQHDI